MLAPTRDLVVELNERARSDRLRGLAEQTGMPIAAVTGREAHLSGGVRASAGDTIITRKNNRRIRISATDWVKNGDRWRVDAVNDNGSLSVTHLDANGASNRHVTLPARYVRKRVQLGYASTVHGAQGITADTCYTVATGDESRQLLYVAMTRGRHANHVYLTTAGDGDPHSVITRDALLPPTAGDILTRVLARDASPMSATSQRRELTRADVMLEATAARYHYLLNLAAEDHLGPDRLAAIDATAEQTVAGITSAEAYPALRSHLALLSLDGHDPAAALGAAVATSRGLADARDPAAVLDWRLSPSGQHASAPGPLPWLTGVPATLAADPGWAKDLHERADLVKRYRDELMTQARHWTPTSAPTWALPLVDQTHHDPELIADLAVWRAAHAVEDTDRRPTGPTQPSTAEARTQRMLDQRITRVLGNPDAAAAKWAPLADSVDTRITSDPYWPTLADRLTAIDRAGIDAAALTRSAAGTSPLPDEQPAAALWWRLAGHLSPAAMTATDQSESDTLRPPWTSDLVDVVGEQNAARVMADPAWPSLVAAVTAATTPDQGAGVAAGNTGSWEPHQILALSYDLLQGGQPDDEPLHPDELATALVWRVAMITDPSAAPTATFAPTAEPAPEPEPAPTFAYVDGESGVEGTDEDWLESLVRDDLPPEVSDGDAPDPDTDDGNSDPFNTDLADDFTRASFPLLVERWEQADHSRAEAEQNREHFWATAAVPRERLVELNTLAEDFFTRHYNDTWAADYTRERLGTDLSDDPRAVVGYAPSNWTALTNHLRRNGASDVEILGAGLGTQTRTGNIVDRFRDRLVFPIKGINLDHDPTTDTSGIETLGFIGRRNPAKTDEDNAGPKYLNTADTDLFTKGHTLYGLAEHAAALAAGATPVVVEGPMDALAVTLAGTNPDGSTDYVGVAPLGIAFTYTQADALRPYISTCDHGPDAPTRAPIVVATDNDRAGQQAAHRAFWQLVARGEDPRHLVVTHGKDPAELLHSDGAAALRAGLESAAPLADQVIADRTAPFADRLDTIEGRVHAARRAADVIGALPAETWLARANATADQFGLAPTTVINDVLDRGHEWTEDPRALARQRIAERLPEPARPAPATTGKPATRWADLAVGLSEGLVDDPHWPTLAEHLARAEATGYDVTNRLTILAAQRPLDNAHRARDLDLRLVSDWPRCLPPTAQPHYATPRTTATAPRASDVLSPTSTPPIARSSKRPHPHPLRRPALHSLCRDRSNGRAPGSGVNRSRTALRC
ncbi:toprim domain-containing protein, partial [uncultured Jatrophihabitans sp.]|uniref:toprim domain-containing protein n=1 Tax=uncultured Jatrophihabitans sp. TaxID=1610747 RepID=UPI0035CC207C